MSEADATLMDLTRAGLTIRGPHTNVRWGPFSRTRSQDFLICGSVTKKVDDLFLVVVTFKCTLNVQTSKQCGKNLAADRRGPPSQVGPSHGTTGTMDNPALGLTRALVQNVLTMQAYMLCHVLSFAG